MKHSERYLLLLCLLLACLGVRAQYNPDNPEEPGARQWKLTLKATPANVGYFNISNLSYFEADQEVSLYAYDNGDYHFVSWEDEQGNVLSTTANFTYVMPERHVTLTARYVYNPGSPEEPGKISIRRHLYLRTNPANAGWFNLSSDNNIEVGNTVFVQAYNNQYYSFVNWTKDGEVISTSSGFTYTMPEKDVTLVANYAYNYSPGNPDEPGMEEVNRCNLYAMREGVLPGQAHTYHIYMENAGVDVTGFSLDVKFPAGFTVDPNSISLTARATNHTLKVEDGSDGSLHFIVNGATTIDGVGGSILEIPIHVPDTVTVDNIYTVELSDGKVFKADGTEESINVRSGSLQILRQGGENVDSPDFVVNNLSTTTANAMPGGVLHLSWQVANEGNLTGYGNWTERIYLLSADGSKLTIGTIGCDNDELAPGAIVSRSADVVLPQLLGMEGAVDLGVTIVPAVNSGEISDNVFNNSTQTADAPLTLGKQLFLSLPQIPLQEGSTSIIRCQLSRSGRWAAPETFQLTKVSGDARLQVPQSVTIPRDQGTVYFYITLADNDVCDVDSVVNLRIEAQDGYEAVEGSFIVRDDELPPLKVTTSATEVEEGDTFQLTVSLSMAATEPLSVSISSEHPKRFRYPVAAVIPAGASEVVVDVNVVDDDVPDEEVSSAFTVYAQGYEPAETIVILKDDDLPVLELTLTPNKVKEGDGPVSVTGTLRRITNQDKRVTVRLSNDSEGALFFSQTELQMAKNVEQMTFNFGPVDNVQVDGDRTYTITAAVWLSSCSCSANGQEAGNVSAQFTVFDDDGPALSLSASQSTVREGVTTRLIVTRNTAVDQPLTVSLSSDHDDMLTYNRTLTIPAGQQSAYVEVTPSANSASGDSQTIVFTVEADGFSSGTCWLMVTDQTLPDARIKVFAATPDQAEVGTDITLTAEVVNDGMADLRDATPVYVYRRGEEVPAARLYTKGAMAPGEGQVLTQTLTLPSTVGELNYYAVVNEDRKIKELNYTNNISADIAVTSLSSFRAAVLTDKSVYTQGEKVSISVQLSGKNTANAEFDLYVVNEGAREVRRLKADADGRFQTEWQLLPQQCGHFAVGACYPDEDTSEEMTAFDVYGVKRVDNSYITCDVTMDEPFSGEIALLNPGLLALSDVKVEVTETPEGCDARFDIPDAIGPGERATLKYTLTGSVATTGNDWDHLKLSVVSKENTNLDIDVYYYCRNAASQLVCNLDSLNLNITKGTTRDIPLVISNKGRGETGTISLALPTGFSLISSSTSLKQNEEATLVLRFTPPENMKLNVPAKGTIGVNCTNGNGIVLPFVMTLVSEKKGFLKVDVCDEYTYYTDEAPKVEGASVKVIYPATGQTVAQGLTGKEGSYTVELTEGYYRLEVEAEKHEKYANYVFVNPAATEQVTVNISYQPITVSWDVEETEVEDEYHIVTNVEYETNVPMPVVKIDIPKSIDGDNMAVGDAVVISMKLTNIGLIRADNVEVLLPKDSEVWKFEALGIPDGFSILPKDSVIIPVRITRIADSKILAARRKNPVETMVNIYGKCMIALGDRYEWACGEAIKYNEAAETMAMEMCALSATSAAVLEILNNLFGGGAGSPGGDGGGGGGGDFDYLEVTKTLDICDLCDATKAQNLIETLAGKSGLKHLMKAIRLAIKMYRDQGKDVRVIIKREAKDKAQNAATDFLNSKTKGIFGYIAEIYEVTKPCEKDNGNGNEKARNRKHDSNRDWQVEFEEIGTEYAEQLTALDSILLFTFGDRIWYEEVDDEKLNFLEYATNLPDDYFPSDEELMEHKPMSVTLEEMRAYINHVNGQGPNYPTTDMLDEKFATYEHYDEVAAANNYGSMQDFFEESYLDYVDKIHEMTSSSVCATISLSIEQRMTMTRQAFRGRLKVFNGHEELPMKDVRLNLLVRDMYGTTATAHEFQINAETLEGFQGPLSLIDGWTLDAQATGTATILFIPTKNAAPTEPVRYSFGGTLTYIDPFTGQEVIRDLYPVELTVKPSPELDLTYFMQRDIFGDDALTNEVEAMQPSEFALLIHNKGYGDATNVRMVTQQPVITENEKDLLINFELISSQVNGGEASLSFGKEIANDFGTIPAQSYSYAQWWLTSTLLGHFTKYDVNATHITSYGNEDLSLLDEVTIHELIHGFGTVDGHRGFMVNDIIDAEDQPDMIYFTNGEQKSVGHASLGISKLSATDYLLQASSSTMGWCYGSLTDPTGGKQKLASIICQDDGTEIPVDNVWQTWCTLHDGKDPVHEKRLHFVGDLSAGGRTFLLSFEPLPDIALRVDSFKTVPLDAEVVTESVKELSVVFNKPIDATTFTNDDVSLLWQGIRQDASQIVISQTDSKEYKLNMGTLTNRNGYYLLTVYTNGIMDSEGFLGSEASTLAWTQLVDGTGIASTEADGQLCVTISPIPVTDRMTISGNFNVIDRLAVYSLNGIPVLQMQQVKPSTEVNVSRLTAGVYIIALQTDRGMYRMQFLKE